MARRRCLTVARLTRLLPAVALLALLGACGGSAEERGGRGAGRQLAADLRVSVRPEGPRGDEEIRRIRCTRLGRDAREPRCRRLASLTRGDLEPVPARTACAQIYAGPATARVTGELRGAAVSASFKLTDACELARWKRNAALLGAPPR